MFRHITLLLFLSVFIHTVCVANAIKPGGETTQDLQNRHAFAQPAANLNKKERRIFFFGNRLFNTQWIPSPSSVTTFDGLGPLFNRTSCSGCHLRDGRGQPPKDFKEPFQSMLIRLSIPSPQSPNKTLPDPTYGGQLNDRGIHGVPHEGKVYITYTKLKGKYSDGEEYILMKPHYHFYDLQYGNISKNIQISPRVAPHMIGLGLLEAIKQEDIISQEDIDDQDQDGISGKANYVQNVETGEKQLGRFGWKANQPTLKQQNAGAFLGDLGITTSLFPEENCTKSQKECLNAYKSKELDLSDDFLEKLTFYTQTLAVPSKRKNNSNNVIDGEKIFSEIGCGGCHTASYVTGKTAVKALSNQKIYPYTDLLLHDMGEELADFRPDGEATGLEWKTPPLWGIGLFKTVNSHTRYLHDGRARSLEEAILWHGGEALQTQKNFTKLSKDERDNLIEFLKSL